MEKTPKLLNPFSGISKLPSRVKVEVIKGLAEIRKSLFPPPLKKRPIGTVYLIYFEFKVIGYGSVVFRKESAVDELLHVGKVYAALRWSLFKGAVICMPYSGTDPKEAAKLKDEPRPRQGWNIDFVTKVYVQRHEKISHENYLTVKKNLEQNGWLDVYKYRP